MACDQHSRVVTADAACFDDLNAVMGFPPQSSDCSPELARVQVLDRKPRMPADRGMQRLVPQAAGDLFGPSFDQFLVRIAFSDHHSQDLKHGVGKVRVPPAGAEADLAEDFTVAEGEGAELI